MVGMTARAIECRKTFRFCLYREEKNSNVESLDMASLLYLYKASTMFITTRSSALSKQSVDPT